MTDVWKDLRHSLQMFLKNPGFTLAAVSARTVADGAVRLKQLSAGVQIIFRLRRDETERYQNGQSAHRLADCTTQNGCRTGKATRRESVLKETIAAVDATQSNAIRT